MFYTNLANFWTRSLVILAKIFSIISGKIFADNLIDFSYIVRWDWNFPPRAKLRRPTKHGEQLSFLYISVLKHTKGL